MSTYLYRVNAFSQDLTSGNPAYVIRLTSPIQKQVMQGIAKELNLPITAFLLEQQCNVYELRWFTPSEEIKLCGHGTLAAAHILWEEGIIEAQHPITFTTKSGHLKVEKVRKGIQLAFSTDVPSPIDITPTIQQLVNVPILKAAQNSDRYLIEVADEESLKGLVPNLDLLATLPVTGLVVTSPSTKYDFISRYFAPGIGIDEDFVTGSAHCGLAPYWSQRLNKKQLYAFQSSERGGELFIDYQDDLTYITGKAITIYKSHFNELLF
ncbi:PhzF family phenazine biosynthesis protein [Priestia megaterium]|uniref:PhzF family phenazine biosynthesis protein n=1 Tax=Priestia megaterium TaxID=1404 RepID=UPI002E241868|nr:PhzF family phenazine biosynthesis protein [Priestia megaterium]MED4268581.1 PhzF family phenazine biosynthesis protein [Priestia megaterium]MED4280257.1 PhzF family phenazine biosynthesis protein [Priestia megaterium]MED4319701.1 PhzF family phenazine biosynthesis protein [Priestia megaterium]